MRNFVILIAFGVFVSCTSTGPKTAESEPDVILSRIDGMDERPNWLIESEPFRIANGQVVSLGQTEIPGSDRVNAGYRIAEDNAKAHIANAISSRLEFIFQNAEEGTSMDSTQARYIGAEASKIVTSSIRQGQRYYEKVATTGDDGRRLTRYKIFATVTMPEADFKRAITDAIRKANGKGGLSEDFAKRVDLQWSKFVGDDEKQSPSEK